MDDSVSAETVRVALAAIAAEAVDGRLRPEAVVAAAASPRHPLHRYFTWDDAAAAQQHRVAQARQLIRSVEVRVTTTARVVEVVHYVRDPRALPREQGYLSLSQVREDQEVLRSVLVQEFARAAAALRRARDIAAALESVEPHDIEALLVDLDGIVGQVAPVSAA